MVTLKESKFVVFIFVFKRLFLKFAFVNNSGFGANISATYKYCATNKGICEILKEV